MEYTKEFIQELEVEGKKQSHYQVTTEEGSFLIVVGEEHDVDESIQLALTPRETPIATEQPAPTKEELMAKLLEIQAQLEAL